MAGIHIPTGYIEQERIGPGEFYDTVEIALPASTGFKRRVFVDIANKAERDSNLTMPCRLPAYNKIHVHRVWVELSRWSGDDMTEYLLRYGHFEFSVNTTRLVSRPLRQMLSGVSTDFRLGHNDDFRAEIGIPDVTPWSEPYVEELVGKPVVETQQIDWPEWALRVASRFDVPLPTLEKSKTTWDVVRRPRRGTLLATVHLEGSRSEPIGH